VGDHDNEPAPKEEYVQGILARLFAVAVQRANTLAILWKHLGKWACWLKSGLSTLTELEQCVQTHLPNIFTFWIPGAKVSTFGLCH
jgi:hypothetical protein